MARKTKEDAQRTRARILASALTLFVRNGYERTTFTEIAAQLKLTKGAVYWHFKTKEALLIALVDETHARFEEHISARISGGKLSFLQVAEIMGEVAERVVGDVKNRAFFLFLRTQVKWGVASMAKVRDDLVASNKGGPYQAFRRAVEGDRAAGLVRPETDPEEVAAMCMAVWDGLVQGQIDGFLKCDMAAAIRHAFDAVWQSIRVGRKTESCALKRKSDKRDFKESRLS